MPNKQNSVFIDIHEAARILGYHPRHARRLLAEHLAPPMKQRRKVQNVTGVRADAVRWVRTDVVRMANTLRTRNEAAHQSKSIPARLIGNHARKSV